MNLKNKVLSGVMLSLVVLATASPLTTVKADSFDAQIAAQNAKIDAAAGDAAAGNAAVAEIQKQVDDANARLKDLEDQSLKNSAQITSLAASIKDRNDSLKAQARSAQTEGGATSYINTILNAKSLTDVVQKVTAMSQVVNTSNAMVKQQEADQKALLQKQADNQKAYAEATTLKQQLDVQGQQLQVAQLSLQVTLATAQDQKNSLLAQKATAEAAATAAVAAQAKINATQKQQESTTNSNPTPIVQNGGGSTGSTPSTPSTGDDYSGPYPWGQCTWGVWEYFGKSINYRGNAADWVVYANSGLAVGTIAVFPGGVDGADPVYGHVAVVVKVNGDGSFVVSETNAAGGLGVRVTRLIPNASGVSFIRP